MSAVLELLAEHPVLLLFLVVGLGAAVGHVTVKGIGLGAAAVLFLALVFGGLGSAHDVELVVPPAFGTLGLTLFTFTVGVVSGAEFFASLRKSLRLIASMMGVLCTGALVAVGLGRVLDLSPATVAGTFAGAVTNTPALAAARDAAGDQTAPTGGYAGAYVFGVVGIGRRDAGEHVLIAFARQQVAVFQGLLAEVGQHGVARAVQGQAGDHLQLGLVAGRSRRKRREFRRLQSFAASHVDPCPDQNRKKTVPV